MYLINQINCPQKCSQANIQNKTLATKCVIFKQAYSSFTSKHKSILWTSFRRKTVKRLSITCRNLSTQSLQPHESTQDSSFNLHLTFKNDKQHCDRLFVVFRFCKTFIFRFFNQSWPKVLIDINTFFSTYLKFAHHYNDLYFLFFLYTMYFCCDIVNVYNNKIISTVLL